jgi:peptidoglycan/LPS O-acetylase OafA/YrhL
MNKTLWQLDAIRGAAAAYVVVYHARCFAQTSIAPMMSFGPEAVILFFLLSGFVISYSSERRLCEPGGVRSYLVHRFRRIYPLFLVALALTISIVDPHRQLFDVAGSSMDETRGMVQYLLRK